MAGKRMFRLDVLDTDAFLEMPLSTQALYFHLNLRADDDGFIGNPKRILRTIGAQEDDLKLLIAKNFVIQFEDGVIVIKHWRMHNTLSAYRYHETKYTDCKDFLLLKKNGAYSLNEGEKIDDSHLIEMAQRQANKGVSDDRQSKDTSKTDERRPQYKNKNKNKNKSKDILSGNPTEEVVNYLNQMTGKNFKATTDKTRKCINARLNEGFTVDDFKAVIDIKCAKWLKDDKMRDYLRPETLFGTKFEGYLNEAPHQPIVSKAKEDKDLSELTEQEWHDYYEQGKVTMEDYYNYHE